MGRKIRAGIIGAAIIGCTVLAPVAASADTVTQGKIAATSAPCQNSPWWWHSSGYNSFIWWLFTGCR